MIGIAGERRNNKYYVYSGYVSDDNYDGPSEGHPCYTLKEFGEEKGVIDFKKEFNEVINGYADCGHIIFKVFEGKELQVKPKEKVIDYELSS